MFKKKLIDLGTVKVGQLQIVEFEYDNIDLITKTEVPCGCTELNIDSKNKMIKLKYIPSSIPNHLKTQGYYLPLKNVVIHHKQWDGDDTSTKLEFTAKVIN